jgi:uncharacterized membrane protein YfcA
MVNATYRTSYLKDTFMNHILMGIIVFCTYAISTLIGFGSSMIMEPIFFLALPEHTSFLITAILHGVTGIYRAWLFRHYIDWRLVLSFGIPGVIAAIAGSLALVTLRVAAFGHILGVFLIAYVLFSYIHPHFVMPNTKKTNLVGGLASGFLAGLFGIRGAVQAAFLDSYRLENNVYIGTSAAIACMVDSARLSMYLLEGMRLTHEVLHHLLIFVPCALLGVKVAHYLVPYITPQYLRLAITLALLVVGVLLAGGFYELVAP